MDSIELALDYTHDPGQCNSAIFNVGSGVGVAITEVAELLMENFGTKVEIVSLIIIILISVYYCMQRSEALPPHLPLDSYADMGQENNRLKFTSKTRLKEGLKVFIMIHNLTPFSLTLSLFLQVLRNFSLGFKQQRVSQG